MALRLVSYVTRTNEDAQLRAWFAACCLCSGDYHPQSMAKEVVIDELVARTIFEKLLPKMDRQEVGGFEEISRTNAPILMLRRLRLSVISL